MPCWAVSEISHASHAGMCSLCHMSHVLNQLKLPIYSNFAGASCHPFLCHMSQNRCAPCAVCHMPGALCTFRPQEAPSNVYPPCQKVGQCCERLIAASNGLDSWKVWHWWALHGRETTDSVLMLNDKISAVQIFKNLKIRCKKCYKFPFMEGTNKSAKHFTSPTHNFVFFEATCS